MKPTWPLLQCREAQKGTLETWERMKSQEHVGQNHFQYCFKIHVIIIVVKFLTKTFFVNGFGRTWILDQQFQPVRDQISVDVWPCQWPFLCMAPVYDWLACIIPADFKRSAARWEAETVGNIETKLNYSVGSCFLMQKGTSTTDGWRVGSADLLVIGSKRSGPDAETQNKQTARFHSCGVCPASSSCTLYQEDDPEMINTKNISYELEIATICVCHCPHELLHNSCQNLNHTAEGGGGDGGGGGECVVLYISLVSYECLTSLKSLTDKTTPSSPHVN